MKTTLRHYEIANGVPSMIEFINEDEQKTVNINIIPLTKTEDNIYCSYPKLMEETKCTYDDIELMGLKITYENGIPTCNINDAIIEEENYLKENENRVIEEYLLGNR
jgi:hypothetical protein